MKKYKAFPVSSQPLLAAFYAARQSARFSMGIMPAVLTPESKRQTKRAALHTASSPRGVFRGSAGQQGVLLHTPEERIGLLRQIGYTVFFAKIVNQFHRFICRFRLT